MLFRAIMIASSIAVAAGGVSASTVTIDFTSGTATGVVSAAPPVTNGTFSQSGFDVGWSYVVDNAISPGQSITTNISSIGLLSDCGPFGGCGAYSNSLTISKSGGGTFSLTSVDTGGTYEGLGVEAIFTPFLADGVTLDTANTQIAQHPILRNNLVFNGLKSDGSTVSVKARTASATNVSADPTSVFGGTGTLGADNGFGPSQASFAPGDLASLSDLTQLSIAIDNAFLTNIAAVKSLQDFGAPLEILQGLNQCGFTSCTIAGVGQFDFSVPLTGGRNDTHAVQLSGITLTTPSAVPLPASALLLLGGLGLMGAARARRRS